ncbi:SpoIIE family protein phosphatase [Ktedonospora formicarum]|uniref:PPM-type phosphatase domain-containing protein n=1 Tax=Ktedonospora formicarum TaxID=2778364 RepID=A0A8J3MU94_9CHLR|nr:SpoIIE family protein phosphatase [Ktedonospora formicarum]GHO49077.1 hypothetical protein KSX_72400 [Ktedonospora formicarum]
MVTLLQKIQQKLHWRNTHKEQAQPKPVSSPTRQTITQVMDIAPNDPIVAYFLSSPHAVEIDKLQLDSPILHEWKANGVKLAIPLVNQGELVGLINLGKRLSEQDYSSYDKGLLNSLATQAASALRVAQLVQNQKAQARERERMAHELEVARLIQQTLLPQELPNLPGWQLTTYYQPARAVGGDFYDFIPYGDGRLGLVVGDVTDKGIPAALVMATTRSILRSAAQENLSPGKVLESSNNLLFPDIPPRMFVTCFFAILDLSTGHLCYANAGHDLPYRWHEGEVAELRATGMPLGLMPGMQYEEKETILAHGESILLYSDGLVEAHDPEREMFGFPRLIGLLGSYPGEPAPIDYLRHELAAFTGNDWEQEDDITLVTLQRTPAPDTTPARGEPSETEGRETQESWQPLQTWTIPSEAGNERLAMTYVAEAVKPFHLSSRSIDQLQTAVAEATMNAMEHGNHYNPEVPVILEVLSSEHSLAIRISDQGGEQPLQMPDTPDIDAKLAELQSPRGWGLFLIQNMVDDMRILSDEHTHTIELIFHLKGDSHVHQNA